MLTSRTRAAGFTLIELLVVISLVGVLAALSAGAFMRVRATQTKSASAATLNKLHSALDNRMKAINESVNEDQKKNQGQWPNAMNDAGQNPDVAKTLLTYAKVKNELPMSFAEAKAVTVVGTITLQPKAQFLSLPNVGTGTPEESGACFYLAITKSAGGGAMTNGDGLEQQASDYTGAGWTARVFKDSYGMPIAFVRHAYTPELNGPEFVKTSPIRDPFDPAGKLTATTMPAATWNQLRVNVPAFANFPLTYAANQNHLPTLISAGPNKSFEANILAGTDNDNIPSYRLRREGSTGN